MKLFLILFARGFSPEHPGDGKKLFGSWVEPSNIGSSGAMQIWIMIWQLCCIKKGLTSNP
jgi:hypothetical protein